MKVADPERLKSHLISNGLGVRSLLSINCSKSCARKNCGRVHRLGGTERTGQDGAHICAMDREYFFLLFGENEH